MAAKGGSYANSLLALIFNGTLFANVAENASSSPITSLYVSLHQATLNSSSTQTSSEATYGAYAMVAVVRTSSGWTVTSNSVSPVGNITFPTSTGTPSETEVYGAVGTASTGTGEILYFGPISPTITVNAAGITPQLTNASTITEV